MNKSGISLMIVGIIVIIVIIATDFLAKGGCSDCCRLNNNGCGFLGISENDKILVKGTGYFKW